MKDKAKGQTEDHILNIRDIWDQYQSVKAGGFIDYCNGDISPRNYRVFVYGEIKDLDLCTPIYCIKTFVIPKLNFQEVKVRIERINGTPALFVPGRYEGKLAITVHEKYKKSN